MQSAETKHPAYVRMMTKHRDAFWDELHFIRTARPGEREFVAIGRYFRDGSFRVGMLPRDLALTSLCKYSDLQPALEDIERGERIGPGMTCLVHVILRTDTEVILQPMHLYPEAGHA